MAAVSIADLTSDFRFHARILHPGDNNAQLQWLTDQYLLLAEDRSGAEITAHAFEGSSHSAQFRDSSPEQRRQAVQAAIEAVEAKIAGLVDNSERRPFGIRFAPGREPAALLG
jgi:hypothetical protein